MEKYRQIARPVRLWLAAGLILIAVQVIIGGITRLTGSGLSITKWEIVTGTFPPVGEAAWQEAFDLYRETPQYHKINKGFSLEEFKFIYFWEYFHRLWARAMGFVFLIPFIYFFSRKMFNKPLLRRLAVVFLLACLVATFGWIMVASGLIERPWVNAYKLSLHLGLAFLCFGYLWWTYLLVLHPGEVWKEDSRWKRGFRWITGLVIVQLMLGGLMSGMKAGLFFPTWPMMNGEWVPGILFDRVNWTAANFGAYDSSVFMPALVQVLHRFTAYVIFGIVVWLSMRVLRSPGSRTVQLGSSVLLMIVILQLTVGIVTVLSSHGVIPVFWGVLHQGLALVLLSTSLYMNYLFSRAVAMGSHQTG